MFDVVADRTRRRRSLWAVSLFAHGLGGGLVVGLPYLRAADEEIPSPKLRPPSVIDLTLIPRGNPDAGGQAERRTATKPPAHEAVSQPPKNVQLNEIPEAIPDPAPIGAGPSSSTEGPDGPEGPDPGPIGLPIGDPNAPPREVVDPTQVLDVTSVGVVAPVLLHRVDPTYPEPMRIARIPGEADVRAIIETDGRVSTVEVVTATNSLFGRAAAEAVAQWLYRGGRVRDQAARVRVLVHVRFTLR